MHEKLKRIFPFVASLAIVFCMVAVPLSVSAAGVSGVSSDQWYSALTFDTISYDGYMAYPVTCTWPFPFNSGVYGSGEFYFGDGEYEDYAYGFTSLSETEPFPTITGSLVLPSLSPSTDEFATLSLSAGQQIIDSERVQDYYISWEAGSLGVSGGSCTITYCEISDKFNGDDHYSVVTKTETFPVSGSNGLIPLGSWLYRLGGERFVFIERIELDIRFERLSISSTKFYFSIPTDGSLTPNVHMDFYNWFSQYDTDFEVKSSSAFFDVTDWLSTSVGSFLELEIAPGFSINKIFYLLLIIGVFLAFIKIIS